MANRTGIELLPHVCRIVEVQGGGGWFGRSGSRAGGSRVRAFREIPYSSGRPDLLTAELRSALSGRGAIGRRAWVAVWGLRANHQSMLLPPAARSDVEVLARREARSGVAPGGTAQAGDTSDGVVVGEMRDAGRREVGYVSVPPAESRSRIQPLLDAGIEVEGLVTPALAHSALVRQRSASFPDAVTAVLSVNGRATAITVLRGAVVLFARELPWGHETERAEAATNTLDAASFTARVGSELKRSLVYLKQNQQVDVSHVLVCGDMPDLRLLTGPLMHELNVEVETLDSLEGFDVARLPEPAEEFRSRIGAYRTAWALAADAAPPVNLLPREVRAVRVVNRQTQKRLWAAAVAGVLIAAVAWGGVQLLARSSRSRADGLRRQVATLEPQVQAIEADRQAGMLVSGRMAALGAFGTQGPRVAQVLSAIGRGLPPEIALTSIKLEPADAAWILTIDGKAIGTNPAEAQASFNTLLGTIASSPVIGRPLRSPSIRIEDQEPEPPAAPAVQRTDVKAGASGAWVDLGERDGQPYRRGVQLVERNGRLVRTPGPDLSPEYLRGIMDGYYAPQGTMSSAAGQTSNRTQVSAPEPEPLLVVNGTPFRIGLTTGGGPGHGSAGTGAVVLPRGGSILDFSIEYEVRK